MQSEPEQANDRHDDESAAAQDVGEQLKSRREAVGVSLESVARRLCIRPGILRAYEDNRFEQLPPPPYAIGFLRQYAALLELEAEPLVDALQAALGCERPAIRSTTSAEKPGSTLPAWVWWLLACLAIVLAGGVLLAGTPFFQGKVEGPEYAAFSAEAFRRPDGVAATAEAGHALPPI